MSASACGILIEGPTQISLIDRDPGRSCKAKCLLISLVLNLLGLETMKHRSMLCENNRFVVGPEFWARWKEEGVLETGISPHRSVWPKWACLPKDQVSAWTMRTPPKIKDSGNLQASCQWFGTRHVQELEQSPQTALHCNAPVNHQKLEINSQTYREIFWAHLQPVEMWEPKPQLPISTCTDPIWEVFYPATKISTRSPSVSELIMLSRTDVF